MGVFRGTEALRHGVSRKQLTRLIDGGALVREFPDTYRVAAVRSSPEQRLRAALLWAGDGSAAAGASAGALFDLHGVRPNRPEIVVPRSRRLRHPGVTVHRCDDRAALMLRRVRGVPVTGVEATLMALAYSLGDEAIEVACEDARRRNLTSAAALAEYVARFGGPGRRGSAALRRLVNDLDPRYPARSTLEVKTRRLLVAHGITDFQRELPLSWNGRLYRFDFGFERARTILETNGRRWHDDPNDFERDNEKWSVPARHGYRVVFATWTKVTRHPDQLIEELAATFAA
jgi:very-short-patch-repair endonuclease